MHACMYACVGYLIDLKKKHIYACMHGYMLYMHGWLWEMDRRLEHLVRVGTNTELGSQKKDMWKGEEAIYGKFNPIFLNLPICVGGLACMKLDVSLTLSSPSRKFPHACCTTCFYHHFPSNFFNCKLSSIWLGLATNIIIHFLINPSIHT